MKKSRAASVAARLSCATQPFCSSREGHEGAETFRLLCAATYSHQSHTWRGCGRSSRAHERPPQRCAAGDLKALRKGRRAARCVSLPHRGNGWRLPVFATCTAFLNTRPCSSLSLSLFWLVAVIRRHFCSCLFSLISWNRNSQNPVITMAASTAKIAAETTLRDSEADSVMNVIVIILIRRIKK